MGKVTWQVDHLVQGEGAWTHEAVQILLVMNQAWFRRLNTERHDLMAGGGVSPTLPHTLMAPIAILFSISREIMFL